MCKIIKKLLCSDKYKEERAIGEYKIHLKKYGKLEYTPIDACNFTFMGHNIRSEWVICAYSYLDWFVDDVCIFDRHCGDDRKAFFDLAIRFQKDKERKVNKLYYEQHALWCKLPEWYKMWDK